MKTFCIFKDIDTSDITSKERWTQMQEMLPNDDLMPVRCINPAMWESGGLDENGLPLWNADRKQEMVSKGKLSSTEAPSHTLIPSELSNAMSHSIVWEYMVYQNIGIAVILEDDIELTLQKKNRIDESFTMPADADVLMLSGADKKFDPGDGNLKDCITIGSGDELLSGCGTFGYVITLAGAKRALEAQFPTVLPLSKQWWMRAFDSVVETDPTCPKLSKQGKAYGLKKAIVFPSKIKKKPTVQPEDGVPSNSKTEIKPK